MKFCMTVGLPGIVIHAKLNDDRFRHIFVVGVEFQVYPLTLVVVLTLTAESAIGATVDSSGNRSLRPSTPIGLV